MNYIWCLMIIVSIVVSIFNGTVDQTINGAFEDETQKNILL